MLNMLTENQQIGVGLICLGLGFVVLGVMLLCDTKFIAIGNALFMVGLVFTMGLERLKALFMRYVYLFYYPRVMLFVSGVIELEEQFASFSELFWYFLGGALWEWFSKSLDSSICLQTSFQPF